MSGGSLDYCYVKVEDASSTIYRRARTPLERAFSRHLDLVARALRSIEWEFSGDGDDECEKNIRAVVSRSDELRMVISDADDARRALEAALLCAKAQETPK